jgi:hypothetical protein
VVKQPAKEEQRVGGKPSQADKLVELAQGIELFHTPGGHDSEGYATVEVNGHKETWRIGSKGFRSWLARLMYNGSAKVPNSEAVQDAVNTIRGKAIYDGPEHPIAVRIAEREGAIYLDLADEHWRVVRITADGWSVISDSPVKFVRRRGMLALPEPVHAGKLDELRALVNVPDDNAWMLFVAWLLATYRPGLPFPTLVVNGDQGSAKSTLCKMGRALIDPNIAALRRPPRDDRDLLIAAVNSWIIGYDNLSTIKTELSDALCLLATGGGLGTRELYSDDEEKLFDAMRPVMVNGIADLATRGDLLDRAVCLTLPLIPDDKRRDEAELWRQFEQARPSILGALLDAVSAALKNLPNTKLSSKPRMADFALFVVAAESAFGWKPGAFLIAYNENRGAANEQTLEFSIIASPILALIEACGSWTGTAQQLLDELEVRHTDEKTRKRKEWPKGPRKLSGDLRRLAPNLRRAGIDVDFDKREPGGKRRRIIHVEQTRKTPSQSSQNGENAVQETGRYADGAGQSEPGNRPAEKPAFCGTRDGRDDRDGSFHPHSDGAEVGGEVTEWTA